MTMRAVFASTAIYTSPKQLSSHRDANVISLSNCTEVLKKRIFPPTNGLQLCFPAGQSSEQTRRQKIFEGIHFNLQSSSHPFPTPSPFSMEGPGVNQAGSASLVCRLPSHLLWTWQVSGFRSMINVCEINQFFCLFVFFTVGGAREGEGGVGSARTYIMLTKSWSKGTWIVANSVICVPVCCPSLLATMPWCLVRRGF